MDNRKKTSNPMIYSKDISVAAQRELLKNKGSWLIRESNQEGFLTIAHGKYDKEGNTSKVRSYRLACTKDGTWKVICDDELKQFLKDYDGNLQEIDSKMVLDDEAFNELLSALKSSPFGKSYKEDFQQDLSVDNLSRPQTILPELHEEKSSAQNPTKEEIVSAPSLDISKGVHGKSKINPIIFSKDTSEKVQEEILSHKNGWLLRESNREGLLTVSFGRYNKETKEFDMPARRVAYTRNQGWLLIPAGEEGDKFLVTLQDKIVPLNVNTHLDNEIIQNLIQMLNASDFGAKFKENAGNELSTTNLCRTQYHWVDPADKIHPRNEWNTSDHTPQVMSATLQNVVPKEGKLEVTEIVKVKGATWNLLNKCISKHDSIRTKGPKADYKNNPWDYTERNEDYLKRKERQFKEIIDIVHDGKMDFMFLQEIDCLTSPPFVNTEDRTQYELLRNKFLKKLRELGWALNVQVPDKDNPNKKYLATLYNTKTLELQVNGNPVAPPPNPLSFYVNPGVSVLDGVGFECQFKHQSTKRMITLTNLHLGFTTNYSESIPNYQREKVKNGQFTIMGGDTNHFPNQDGIVGLINDWKKATSIDGDDNGENITHIDKNTKRVKCLDGFFVCPTKTKNELTQVEIIDEPSRVFEKIPNTDLYTIVVTPQNKHVHLSAPGEEWRRGGRTKYEKEQLELIKKHEKEEIKVPDQPQMVRVESQSKKEEIKVPIEKQPVPDESKAKKEGGFISKLFGFVGTDKSKSVGQAKPQMPSPSAPVQSNANANQFFKQPPTDTTTQMVSVYRAKNGELAIKFPTKELRDAFLGKISGEDIAKTYKEQNNNGRDKNIYFVISAELKNANDPMKFDSVELTFTKSDAAKVFYRMLFGEDNPSNNGKVYIPNKDNALQIPVNTTTASSLNYPVTHELRQTALAASLNPSPTNK